MCEALLPCDRPRAGRDGAGRRRPQIVGAEQDRPRADASGVPVEDERVREVVAVSAVTGAGSTAARAVELIRKEALTLEASDQLDEEARRPPGDAEAAARRLFRHLPHRPRLQGHGPEAGELDPDALRRGAAPGGAKPGEAVMVGDEDVHVLMATSGTIAQWPRPRARISRVTLEPGVCRGPGSTD